MFEEIVVSVIVPVYEAEEYLPKCIKSIREQTHRNLEIILVNDGSPGQSGDICDEFAKQDSRIKVIHKNNGGVSDARNAGMKIATGDYIAFVDCDDYLPTNAYEILLREAQMQQLDISIGNVNYITQGNNSFVFPKMRDFKEIVSGLDYMCYMILCNEMSTWIWIWCRLYRRDLLLKNNLFFEPGMLAEDVRWIVPVMLIATRVKYVDKCVYNWCRRDDSLSNNELSRKFYCDHIDAFYWLEKLFINSISDKKKRKILFRYLLKGFFWVVSDGRLYENAYKNHIRKSFILGKIYSMRTAAEALLFLLNIKLYAKVRNILKLLPYAKQKFSITHGIK